MADPLHEEPDQPAIGMMPATCPTSTHDAAANLLQQIRLLKQALDAERAKRAEAESRATKYWGMFGQVQGQHHTLRCAVLDRGLSPDALIRARNAANLFGEKAQSGD